MNLDVDKIASFVPAVKNYLAGESYFPQVRRVIDLIFSAAIASYLYRVWYSNYSILDVSDYKGIIHFILDGGFILPLTLIFVVHWIIAMIGMTLLGRGKNLIRFIAGRRPKVKILMKTLAGETIASKLSEALSNTDKEYITLESRNTAKNFFLIVKCIIMISIYHFGKSVLGSWLYLGVNMMLIFLATIVLIGNIFFSWLDHVVQKYDRKHKSAE